MEKKRRRSLHNILTMAFTFAMVMVFAGLVGKVEVNAGTCKVTVQVTDTEGTPIPNAKVIFTNYGKPYEELTTVTKNDDGTYNVPFDDDEWWNNYYRYYATADDYKPSASKNGEYLKGAELDLTENNAEMNLGIIKLTYYPPFEQVQDDIQVKRDAIDNYLNESDYDPEEWDTIETIIAKYKKQIEDIEDALSDDETKESAEEKKVSLANILENAKAELDTVATSQDNKNNAYANLISFNPSEEGDPIYLANKIDENGQIIYGKYEITLSLFDKGGIFQVNHDEDTNVIWNAKKSLWYGSSGHNEDFDYIDSKFKVGMFLNQGDTQAAIPNEVGITTGTIENCSVTFTTGKKTVTVTFDLKVVDRRAKGINTDNIPTDAVILNRDADLNYTTQLKIGAENDYYVFVEYDDPGYTSEDITITSLDEDIATVDENNTITPLKAGTATFEASAEGCDSEQFTIEFVKSDEEVKEDDALEAFDKLIASIGNVTLDKETAVQNARDAYDKLSENAKKRLDPDTLNILTKAEATITALKTEAIKKAEELKKAQEAANNTTAPTVQLSKIALKAKAAKGKVKLTWKKSSKADGYIIYRATKKNGKYKQIKMIKSWKKNSFTDKKVKSKKTYYYKIRAYKGTVNGPVSAAKKAKVK